MPPRMLLKSHDSESVSAFQFTLNFTLLWWLTLQLEQLTSLWYVEDWFNLRDCLECRVFFHSKQESCFPAGIMIIFLRISDNFSHFPPLPLGIFCQERWNHVFKKSPRILGCAVKITTFKIMELDSWQSYHALRFLFVLVYRYGMERDSPSALKTYILIVFEI